MRPRKPESPSGEVWALVDTPPNASWPNGFSPRWEAFLHAIAERQRVRLLALRASDAPWALEEFKPERLRHLSVHLIQAGPNPLNEPGIAARLRRLAHYGFGRLPYMSHPERLRSLEARARSERPSLLISFLATTAHLTLGFPSFLPVIDVLEEGLERRLSRIKPTSRRHAWSIRCEARRIEHLYRRLGEKGHRAVVISEIEAAWFGRQIPRGNITVLPHAIDAEYYSAKAAEGDIDAVVFGDFSQARNYEPARRLFDLAREREGKGVRMKWAFVGRAPHESISELAGTEVTVTGYVADTRPWYERARTVVVPAEFGSGVKTTVLQGWAMSRPVVATPFSVNGIEYNIGRDIQLGSTPDALLDQIERMLADRETALKIGSRGRERIEKHHDVRIVAERFADLCDSAISSGG